MTLRAKLLAFGAMASVLAWTPIASAVTLAVGGVWDHPHFAGGSEWLWAWWNLRDQFAAGGWAALSVAAGFLAGSGAVLGASAAAAREAWKGEPLHGESHWATKREAKASELDFTARPRPDAILLGQWGWGPWARYVSLPGGEHVALTARTQSGKGVSFVVPNALSWGGGLICFSVKRDLMEEAAAERERMGQDVFVFDLSDPQRRTHRWNPLGYVRRNDPGTYGDIQRAMWFLVPETRANNPFWDNAARKVATAVGVLLAETPDAKLTVGTVLNAVRRPDYDGYLRGLIDDATKAGRPPVAAASQTIMGWLNRKGEQGPEDVRETLTTALALWNDPVIEAATSEADFDIGTLRSRHMSVFVCGGPADLRLYRPIYGLLFQQLVQLNTREEYNGPGAQRRPRTPPKENHIHRALGLLDEFWALGKQDVLADAAAFTASYGFRWAYVQQSRSQSITAFGKEGADNLFNNTGAEIVFGGADIETAEKVSKWGGNDTVTETTRSRPKFFSWFAWDRQTEQEGPRRRGLILSQEVQRLPKHLLIVQRPGLNLLRLRRVVWFKDPFFRRLHAPPPPVPELRVRVPRS
jgi:type IV secretion system protein VirD4